MLVSKVKFNEQEVLDRVGSEVRVAYTMVDGRILRNTMTGKKANADKDGLYTQEDIDHLNLK